MYILYKYNYVIVIIDLYIVKILNNIIILL